MGMPELQGYTGQEETMAAKGLLEEAIVDTLAMVGITDDGMADVLHVPTQLMPAPGQRFQQCQAIARLRIAVYSDLQFNGCQALEMGHCGLHSGRLLPQCRIRPVLLFSQRMVDMPTFRAPSAHNGEIEFCYRMSGKLIRQKPGRSPVQGKQQDAGGWLVQPVHGVYSPPQLVAQELQRKARLVPINGAAVHQQARRLVDGYNRLILVDDVEGSRIRGNLQAVSSCDFAAFPAVACVKILLKYLWGAATT